MALIVQKAMLWHQQVQSQTAIPELNASFHIASLSVQGENRTGLAQQITEKLAEYEVGISFVTMQSCGPLYSAVFGFSSDDEANRAAALVHELDRALSVRTTLRVVAGTGIYEDTISGATAEPTAA